MSFSLYDGFYINEFCAYIDRFPIPVSHLSLTLFLDWLFDPQKLFTMPVTSACCCLSLPLWLYLSQLLITHTQLFIYFIHTHTSIFHAYLWLKIHNCCLVASFYPLPAWVTSPPHPSAWLPWNPRLILYKNITTISQLYMKVFCVYLVVVNVTQTKLN